MQEQTLGEVARISISPKTLQPKKDNLTRVLEWIHNHPEDCKKTTLTKLSKTILIPNSGLTEKSTHTALYTLSHRGVIYYKGGKWSKDKHIYINYLHPLVPKYMAEEAPTEELRRINQFKNENLDDKPKQTKKESIAIPVKQSDIDHGFSLTLNINFSIQK